MGYAKILLIDNDQERCQYIASVLAFIEYETIVVADIVQAKQTEMDWGSLLVILLNGDDPLDLVTQKVQEIAAIPAKVPVLLLTRSIDALLEQDALACGAVGPLVLPLKYPSLINALHKVQVFRGRLNVKEGRRSLNLFRSLVGHSRAIQEVRLLIEQVAETDASVLIRGDSGTGKEVVARNIHFHSKRSDKPFVPINCGAIPADLLESELFGHEKGAFTGAISARQGRFELAEGGTLFLDEIGDMPLPMQVKLLRVLQERSFERVGSNKTITINVRVISATHRNLDDMIAKETFREDLFYRLNVFPVEVAPLSERVEDIPLLINDLVSRIEHENRGSVRLTPAAVMSLCHYPWRGNIRELANLVERLAIMYPYGVVDVSDLPQKFKAEGSYDAEELLLDSEMAVAVDNLNNMRLPVEGIDLKEHLNNLEYTLIKQALDEAQGVVAHAARRLQMRRTTLVEKLRKFGLQRQGDAAEV